MAIKWVVKYFKLIQVDPVVIEVVKRKDSLRPYPPPGMNNIVTTR